MNNYCTKQKLKPYECLALKYLMNKLNKHCLLLTQDKNKTNISNYLNNHLYIWLVNINNRYFPFDLKQYGFINNTTSLVPNYKYNTPGNNYFRLDENGNQKFFTGFYKISQTTNIINIEIDFIYTASENSFTFDNQYITKTPNQDIDNQIYFYYKSGNYNGIASLIRTDDFPPYNVGDNINVFYFIRKNGILPKNRMQLLNNYTLDNNTITFNDNGEQCQIYQLKVINSWKENHSDDTQLEIGDIVFSTQIQINRWN